MSPFKTALSRIQSASDRLDGELMRCAQQHPRCVAHWASWRRHAVLLRGWRA